MKTRPATEYALLGAMMSGPMHGYEILRFLDSTLGSTWRVSTSQLYTVLKRLEGRGFLESSMEPQETRPSKRVFTLTTKGRQAFLEWIHSPMGHVRDLRIEFLAKLFFIQRLSLKGADQLIEAQIGILKKTYKIVEKKREKERGPFERLVLEFKAATLEAWMKWLDQKAAPFVRKIDTSHNSV
mgnify:CR=1 FL=1